MQKVGDLMKDLGFKKDAPDSVKKAFIKNLIRQAHGASVKEFPTEKTRPSQGQQLSFDFDEEKGIA